MGEQLLPSWLRNELRPVLAFAGAGTALWAGSVALANWAWIELQERLSAWERAGAVALGVYLTGYGCWHAPHIARFAIPAAILVWCAAAWFVAPDPVAEPDDDEPAEPEPEDLRDLVRDLIGDDRGVLLTALRQPLHAPNTRAVREVLAAAGIPVRPGVRTASGNGPGVHHRDLPAPSLPSAEPPAEDVVAGETANANTNNNLRVESREGMTIINDPADRHRAHSLKKAR
ncbi:hypothetical protein ACFZCU_46065 [Streptomyces canus]|uniref:hypothetical protein n=1 Tax=Streptomyces canus TaxID=58343 RepID=UPI0036E4D9F9